MIRSMTGYGEAERETDIGRLRAQISTVNHRFLKISARTPPGFEAYDRDLEGLLRPHMARGHVTVTLTFEPAAGSVLDQPLPELDMPRATRRVELLRRLRDELGLGGTVEVGDVARFGDIFRQPPPDPRETAVSAEDVQSVVEEAAQAVVGMREAEGERLRADLEMRLSEVRRHLDRVEARAPERLRLARERLRTAVRELTDKEEVDEDRLAREIAYLAEKWDLNEEVVRFRSHVELFEASLAEEAGEPVGKRLTFLVQEMLREANTIGAKANDAEITALSVSIKEEIERLREQVENVE